MYNTLNYFQIIFKHQKLTFMKGKCKLCSSGFIGRKGKVFCSVKCKTYYHRTLINKTILVSKLADKILHRNRSILYEILGDQTKQKKIKRKLLDLKKFNWHYMTSIHTNIKGKLLHYVYDYSWMIFSDQEVLIKKVAV